MINTEEGVFDEAVLSNEAEEFISDNNIKKVVFIADYSATKIDTLFDSKNPLQRLKFDYFRFGCCVWAYFISEDALDWEIGKKKAFFV